MLLSISMFHRYEKPIMKSKKCAATSHWVDPMAAKFLPTSDIPATFLTQQSYKATRLSSAQVGVPKPRGIHPLKHPWKWSKEKCWNSPVQAFLDESCKRSKPVFVLAFPSWIVHTITRFDESTCNKSLTKVSGFNNKRYHLESTRWSNQPVQSFTRVLHLESTMSTAYVVT